MTKVRVLVSAYACAPDSGSEPGVGWHWVLAAARRHDVVVVTRANNAPRIEAALRDLPQGDRPRFSYLDLPTARLKRGGRGLRSYYVQWQAALTRRAVKLHREHAFDVAHHLTIAADWLPCGLRGLADELPFVWGPVGGATTTPWALRRWLTPRGLAVEAARTVVSGAGRSLFGVPTAKAAGLAVANNSDVAAWLAGPGVTAEVEPHAVVGPLPPAGTSRQRVAVFAGRLEGWKGLLLAVETISRAPGWRLEVIGDGPDRAAAEALAQRAGVDDRVRFHGHVSLAEAQAQVATAGALLFPSMHDSAPFAVAEAVASEVPVVCLDRGGPADMIRPGGGIAVPASAPDLPSRLAAALEHARVTVRYDGRFSAERLPDLLDRWYASALGA